MTSIRSCLASFVPESAVREAELELLRQRCWTEQGVVVLSPAEVTDPWGKQWLINEATRRWGRRMRR